MGQSSPVFQKGLDFAYYFQTGENWLMGQSSPVFGKIINYTNIENIKKYYFDRNYEIQSLRLRA